MIYPPDEALRRPTVTAARGPTRRGWTVRCTACGVTHELDQADSVIAAFYASAHADAVHDGDVVREGWT